MGVCGSSKAHEIEELTEERDRLEKSSGSLVMQLQAEQEKSAKLIKLLAAATQEIAALQEKLLYDHRHAVSTAHVVLTESIPRKEPRVLVSLQVAGV